MHCFLSSFRTPLYLLVIVTLCQATGLSAAKVNVRVTIENLAPADGTRFTPVWTAFHDGTFDIYDLSAPASEALERIAEDGNAGPLGEAFADSGATGQGAVIFGNNLDGPPIFLPGGISMHTFAVDPLATPFFSLATMVIPSNDAFVSFDNPEEIRVFNAQGDFVGREIIIAGDAVLDAGTEVNDEVPANTAALGQMAPDTGVEENGVVTLHPGFMADGNILAAIPEGDFTDPGYQVLRLTFEVLPRDLAAVWVTVENLAPTDATLLTPFWVSAHDGSFDLFSPDEPVSEAFERLAEDGAAGPLRMAFAEAVPTGSDQMIFGLNPSPPVFRPGDVTSSYLQVDRNAPAARYFSYASMVIPSNDAFIANEDPMAYPLFNDAGELMTTEIMVPGSMVWDAGTEVNDEVPANTAALAQMEPDTGEDENGTPMPHPGFMADGSILDARPAADFTQDGYDVARLTLTVITNPFSGLPMLGGGFVESYLGLTYVDGFPLVWHEAHGWLQVVANDEDGTTFYNFKDELGFLRTNAATYPFLYSFDLGAWVYYFEDADFDGRVFYVFGDTNDYLFLAD